MAFDASGVTGSDMHLRSRLAVLETRVEQALGGSLETGGPVDRLRGLYLRDGDVLELLAQGPHEAVVFSPEGQALLERIEKRVDEAERDGEVTRLRRLQRAFGLDDRAVELLLLAAAPDLDPRFERFYGYLHDDVSRRRSSVGLALRLAGLSPFVGGDRAYLGPASALVRCGLVAVEEAARPVLSRELRVPDRVTGFLIGDDTPDPAVERLMGRVLPVDGDEALVLARGISQGSRLCYVYDQPGAAGVATAAAALRKLGLAALCIDLRRLDVHPVDPAVVRAAGREAVLAGGGLIAGPIGAIVGQGSDEVRAWTEMPVCTILVGNNTWDPGWSRAIPLIVKAPRPTREHRMAQWEHSLSYVRPAAECPTAAVADLRLTPDQISDAVTSAAQVARAEGREVQSEDLRHGARAQNAAGLENLALRIEPCIGWSDLVLPPNVVRLLGEIVDRRRHREQVVARWKMGGASSHRRGLVALFSGPPGTGKTMAAEALAGELGLDLYVVNLATVVDKYIGETEKNLDRIFTEAEQVNGVLFFDEADAVFGKRSDVKDAHDRYANLETAYLLQRMERFDGIAILATNLKSNVDEAFARRLDASVNFPEPDYDARLALWERCLGPHVPRSASVDLEFLSSLKLAGGNIRNITVSAAYLAAAAGTDLEMEHLIRAAHGEYQKLRRLCVEAEFGPWMELISSL